MCTISRVCSLEAAGPNIKRRRIGPDARVIMKTINKKGQFIKGMTPWNKGKKGIQRGPWLGKKRDRVTIQKVSRSLNKGGKIGNCEICKKNIWMTPSEQKQNHHYCSLYCNVIGRIKYGTSRGAKNGNWKNGVTPLMVRIRYCFKYRQWRSDIFTRDDFMCQNCNQRGGELEADHYPKKFADIFHENKITSLEEAFLCEEFWNINNGRTLCKSCHRNK